MAFEMTNAIADGLTAGKRGEGQDRLASILRSVCRALSSPDSGDRRAIVELDVESVFAAVKLLAEYDELEIAPLVQAWDPDIPDPTDVDERKIYEALMGRMLGALRGNLASTWKEVSYIEPLVRAAAVNDGTTIATLNYDLSVEGAGEAAGLQVKTGISDWVHLGRWRWPGDSVPLLKLHGSIDWAWQDDAYRSGRLPSRFIVETSRPVDDQRPPAIVFGAREKLRAEGPFLSILTEFEERLKGASRLVVVGYSFRDDHVNQVIRRWTFDGWGREIVVVDPCLPDRMPAVGDDASFRDWVLNLPQADERDGRTSLRLMPVTARVAFRELFSG